MSYRITRYRKRPVVIEAIQLTRETRDSVMEWVGLSLHDWHETLNQLGIPTLEGTHMASLGDYIVRGVKGEFYPVKPDIFAATYDAEPAAPAQTQSTEEEGA